MTALPNASEVAKVSARVCSGAKGLLSYLTMTKEIVTVKWLAEATGAPASTVYKHIEVAKHVDDEKKRRVTLDEVVAMAQVPACRPAVLEFLSDILDVEWTEKSAINPQQSDVCAAADELIEEMGLTIADLSKAGKDNRFDGNEPTSSLGRLSSVDAKAKKLRSLLEPLAGSEATA